MASPPPQAILLVDGYNIIGAWPELKDVRDRDGLEPARRHLVESLLSYSAYQNYETHVVFDAQYQGTPGSREPMNQHFSVCYTDYRQTADTYIELACSRFRQDARKFQQRLIVATSDRTQQLMVVGYGAEWMSAYQLGAEVGAIAQRLRTQRQQTSKPKSRFLFNRLDPAAQERLSQLRYGQH